MVGCNALTTDLPHRLLRTFYSSNGCAISCAVLPTSGCAINRTSSYLLHRTNARAVGYTTNAAIVHAVGCTFHSFTSSYVFYCIISRAFSGTVCCISCGTISITINGTVTVPAAALPTAPATRHQRYHWWHCQLHCTSGYASYSVISYTISINGGCTTHCTIAVCCVPCHTIGYAVDSTIGRTISCAVGRTLVCVVCCTICCTTRHTISGTIRRLSRSSPTSAAPSPHDSTCAPTATLG